MSQPPSFRDRHHALAYWQAALRKEDQALQAEIQRRLKRLHEIQANILWNKSELRRESGCNEREDTPPPVALSNSVFALNTSFTREDGCACPSSLGFNPEFSEYEKEDD